MSACKSDKGNQNHLPVRSKSGCCCSARKSRMGLRPTEAATPILAPLALFYPNHHALAVNIGDLQVRIYLNTLNDR